MKDKLKFEFSDNERSLILEALNIFRNNLAFQGRTTDAIDEILIKLSDKSKVEFDRIETNIMINTLNNLRFFIKLKQQSPNEVNDILLKLIDETDKKKVFLRKPVKGNGRRQ